MKNTIVGVVLAFVVPKIPFDIFYVSSAVLFGVLACLVLLVIFVLLQRNIALQYELDETRLQLSASEERRRIVNQRRPVARRSTARRASLKRGDA